MRIGSGVQSVSELFGKRQNNSKTSVNGNEAFPQTSMKVYLKTDDMLFSGGNGTGLSFYIKYAEESTDDNPVVIAKGIDENGKEFEEKININDIDLRNASYVEMSAFFFLLLCRSHKFKRTHIMQSVCQFNNNNPDVLRHRKKHFPEACTLASGRGVILSIMLQGKDLQILIRFGGQIIHIRCGRIDRCIQINSIIKP